MIVPDVNLLLYAYDDRSPFHVEAREWWEQSMSGSKPIGLTHPVIFAFVRIGTSTRAFLNPMTLAQASAHVTNWLDRQVTRVLHPDASHVEQVLELLHKAGSAGDHLVTDAQIAALTIAHRGTIHTADRDFERFAGLDCHYPLSK